MSPEMQYIYTIYQEGSFSKAAEFEPHAGWAWTFNENLGLNLTLGLTTFSYPVTGGTAFGFMPKLSIGLEF